MQSGTYGTAVTDVPWPAQTGFGSRYAGRRSAADGQRSEIKKKTT